MMRARGPRFLEEEGCPGAAWLGVIHGVRWCSLLGSVVWLLAGLLGGRAGRLGGRGCDGLGRAGGLGRGDRPGRRLCGLGGRGRRRGLVGARGDRVAVGVAVVRGRGHGLGGRGPGHRLGGRGLALAGRGVVALLGGVDRRRGLHLVLGAHLLGGRRGVGLRALAARVLHVVDVVDGGPAAVHVRVAALVVVVVVRVVVPPVVVDVRHRGDGERLPGAQVAAQQSDRRHGARVGSEEGEHHVVRVVVVLRDVPDLGLVAVGRVLLHHAGAVELGAVGRARSELALIELPVAVGVAVRHHGLALVGGDADRAVGVGPLVRQVHARHAGLVGRRGHLGGVGRAATTGENERDERRDGCDDRTTRSEGMPHCNSNPRRGNLFHTLRAGGGCMVCGVSLLQTSIIYP